MLNTMMIYRNAIIEQTSVCGEWVVVKVLDVVLDVDGSVELVYADIEALFYTTPFIVTMLAIVWAAEDHNRLLRSIRHASTLHKTRKEFEELVENKSMLRTLLLQLLFHRDLQQRKRKTTNPIIFTHN